MALLYIRTSLARAALHVLCVRAEFGGSVKDVFVCIYIFLSCECVFFLNVIFGLKPMRLD